MSFLKRLRRKNQDNSPAHDLNDAAVPEEDMNSDAPQGQGYQPPTNMALQHYAGEQSSGAVAPPPVAPPSGGATLFAGLQLSPAKTAVVQTSEQSSDSLLDNGQTSGLETDHEASKGEGGSAFSFLGVGGGDSGAGVVVEGEESKTQGSVFSFMNVENTSVTQLVHEEDALTEPNSKEEALSAFSFLKASPSEGGLTPSPAGDLSVSEDHASLVGGGTGTNASAIGGPSGSAFSFLHSDASEEKTEQTVTLTQSLGMGTPLPATSSGSDTGAKGQESIPIPEQLHVRTAPAQTPPKSTGPGAALRNFFGRGAKKQSPVLAELPQQSDHGSPSLTSSALTANLNQESVQHTTTREETSVPAEQGGGEVPRPLQQEEQQHATPLPASLSALLQAEGAPSATPTLAFTPKKWALPSSKGSSTSAPAVAVEISGKVLPSPSPLPGQQQSLTPAARAAAKAPPPQASRQLPPAGKKKKRKAVRPGQGREDDDTASLEGGSTRDADTHSLGSESSTAEGKASGDALDEVTVETAGSQQQLVDIEPAAREALQVAKETLQVAKETSQAVPSVLRVSTEDTDSKGGEPDHKVGEPIKSKKDSIPSELRAAFQLDKVATPRVPPTTSEERKVGGEPDHPLVPRSEPLHSLNSSETVSRDTKGGVRTAGGNKGAISGAERLSATMRSSESELAKIRSDQKHVQQKYTDVLDSHLAAVKKQIQTRLHLEELKAKEAQALVDENYELADELSRELESAAHSQEWVTASAVQTAIKEWIESWSKLIVTEVSLQKTLEANLMVIKEEQSKVLAVLEREFSHQFSREKTKLKTLEDKVERERGHVALDREHLEKSETLLKNDLDNQCSQFISTKKKLQAQRDEILGEIAAMEARLRELRDSERSVADAIQAEQEKIEVVRRELSGEQAHLAEQKAELEKREAELKKEETVLSQMKTAYEASTEKKEAEKRDVLASIQTIESVKADGGTRATGLQKFLEESGTLVRGDTGAMLKPSSQLQSLQDRYLTKERAMKDAAAKVFQLQSGISSLKNKVADTERQLPALEEAKKAAVSARQFKEAARISAEIKQLGTDIEEYKSSLLEKEEQLLAKKKEKESSEQGITSIKAELDILQREEDVRHIKDLVRVSDSLKDRVAKSTSSPPLQCVLQYWSLLHELLAQDLCAKHDLSVSSFKSTDVDEKVPSLPVATPDHTDPIPLATQIDTTDVSDNGQGFLTGESSSNEPLVDTTMARTAMGSTSVKALNEKIGEVEALIAQACEAENFELAAQLDEQLQGLKKSLENS